MPTFLEDLSSGSGWHEVGTCVYERPMGLLERRFDYNSSEEGRSDVIGRFFVWFPSLEAKRAFVERVPTAWSILRVKHPALCLTSHAAAPAVIGTSLHPRTFRFVQLASPDQLLRDGLATFIHERVAEKDDFDAYVKAKETEFRNSAKRPLLSHEKCLAKLLVFESKDSLRAAVMLCISHVISDAAAVMLLLRDLLNETSVLPSTDPSTKFDAPIPPAMRERLEEAMRGQVDRLPISSEAAFPVLPSPVTSGTASTARLRWFWAIEYARLFVRARRKPKAPQLERNKSQKGREAHSYWLPLTMSRETTAAFIRRSKERGLSPSMTMYAVLAVALSNILASKKLVDYSPIIIGFPFSLRPFLDKAKHPDVMADAAIRITFGSIVLPFDECSPNDRAKLERVIWRGARLAAEQFRNRFDTRERDRFLASSHLMNVDMFRNTLGCNQGPIGGPKSVINVSMVGDLDRLLPTTWSIAMSDDGATERVRLSEFMVGTRLHVGEGLLGECWTWDGMLTVNLGIDDLVFDLEQGHEILRQVQSIVEAVAAGNQ